MKRLLKAASIGDHLSVSLAIHRVGKTLLIDEFAMPASSPPPGGDRDAMRMQQFKSQASKMVAAQPAPTSETSKLPTKSIPVKKNREQQKRESVSSSISVICLHTALLLILFDLILFPAYFHLLLNC